ncbi:MAG: hypothetical protein EA369_00750 [Bradymonadales bacterium]|nr:MAG: hypothetical protein EA369_00750 [Bradymonadales bacterium]
MWILWISLLVSSLFVSACATRQEGPPPLGSPVPTRSQEPAEIQPLKRPTQSRVETAPDSEAVNLFFAELRLLAETLASGCEEVERNEESRMEDFLVDVTDSGLQFLGPHSGGNQIFNLRLQSIGFDDYRFRGSLEESASSDFPYELRLRVRPGNVLELRYFDQTHRIDLRSVPVLSFQATENRSETCRVTHNVNLFAEETGLFRLPLSPTGEARRLR